MKNVYDKSRHEPLIQKVVDSGIAGELNEYFNGFSVTRIIERFRNEGRINDLQMLRVFAYGGLTTIPNLSKPNRFYAIHVMPRAVTGSMTKACRIDDIRRMEFLPELSCYRAADRDTIFAQLKRYGVPPQIMSDFLTRGFLEGLYGPAGDMLVGSYPDGYPIFQSTELVSQRLLKYRGTSEPGKRVEFYFKNNEKVFPISEQQMESFSKGETCVLKDVSGEYELRVRYNPFTGGLTPCRDLGRSLRICSQLLKEADSPLKREGMSANPSEQKHQENDIVQEPAQAQATVEL